MFKFLKIHPLCRLCLGLKYQFTFTSDFQPLAQSRASFSRTGWPAAVPLLPWRDSLWAWAHWCLFLEDTVLSNVSRWQTAAKETQSSASSTKLNLKSLFTDSQPLPPSLPVWVGLVEDEWASYKDHTLILPINAGFLQDPRSLCVHSSSCLEWHFPSLPSYSFLIIWVQQMSLLVASDRSPNRKGSDQREIYGLLKPYVRERLGQGWGMTPALSRFLLAPCVCPAASHSDRILSRIANLAEDASCPISYHPRTGWGW